MSNFPFSRRSLFAGIPAVGAISVSASYSNTPSYAAPIPARLSHGVYMGANYHLLIVDSPNSGNLVGNFFATYPKGKLTNNKDQKAMVTKQVTPSQVRAEIPGAQVLFASNTTQNSNLRGVQIQDGILRQHFQDPHLYGHGRAWHALGFKKDGSSKIYKYDVDNAESMVTEGVQNTFTFGVALNINGVPQYWQNKGGIDWGTPATDSLLVASARTVLGADSLGRVMVLTVEGRTEHAGLTLDATASLAHELGFYNSVSLDSGGSAQLIVGEQTVQGSADSSGVRALPSWGYITGLAISEVPPTLPPAPAHLTEGTYEGVTYRLVHVKRSRSGGVLGKRAAKIGRLVPRQQVRGLPVAEQETPALAYKAEPRAIYFSSDVLPRGVQIQGGVVFKDFDDVPKVRRGMAALGLRYDGTMKVYQWDKTTAAQMVADGVQQTFSFMNALVIDGVALTPNSDPLNAELKAISARTVLGADASDQVMLLTIEGRTGHAGLSLDATARLAAQLGFHQAVNLDGGGSTQMLVNGSYVHKSSDSSGERFLNNLGFIDFVNVVDCRVRGGIGAYWRSTGAGDVYGHPVEPERTVAGGWAQRFSKGITIYFSDRFGGAALRDNTAIFHHFMKHQGRLGLPISDEFAVAGTYAQRFSKGKTLIWHPVSGHVYELNTGGGIYARFERGDIGFPVTSETNVGSGAYALFEGERGRTAVTWSKRRGITAVSNGRGALYERWYRSYRDLQAPIHDERGEHDGRIYLRLDGGTVLRWSAREGVRVL